MTTILAKKDPDTSPTHKKTMYMQMLSWPIINEQEISG
jgi:hypothetical protein